MKANNLEAIGCKKFKVTTTNSNHKYKVFDNLLERNFNVEKANQVYVGDITYIKTSEGWLYLATIIDLFSRKVIGYKMSNRMTKDLVITALQTALKNRGYPKGVIVHSDRGSQYASHEYKRILKAYGCIGSMSRKGDCWDNAVAESFFATLKKEYIYQTDFNTRLEAQIGIFDYIEAWYNKERSHSTLKGMSPSQFEEANQSGVVAYSKSQQKLYASSSQSAL
jgi:transposase InsO family protein